MTLIECRMSANLGRRTFISVLISWITANTFAQGWGDWERSTPYGSLMRDPGLGTSFLMRKTGQEVEGVSRWYFYKGYTIGEYNKGYFIADERTATIQTFSGQQDWQAELEAKELNPKWARWFQDDWRSTDDLLFILIVTFYISIPVILVFLMIAFRAIRIEYLNPTKPNTLIFIGIVLIGAIWYYLDINPESLY